MSLERKATEIHSFINPAVHVVVREVMEESLIEGDALPLMNHFQVKLVECLWLWFGEYFWFHCSHGEYCCAVSFSIDANELGCIVEIEYLMLC